MEQYESSPPVAHSVPVLPDRWELRRPIPLDGIMERHGFAPFMTAILGLFLAFVLFQIVVSPLATVLLLMTQGVPPDRLLESLAVVLEEHTRVLLTANTVGQVLGLALPAYLLARMHSSRPLAFMRVRSGSAGFILFGVIGLLALTPAIQWLGTVNEQLPLPEVIRRFEQSQIELIERVLQLDTGLLFNLIVLAVTPALCEELLFRGYVQRQAERSIGIAGGILFSGIIFGVYHLRLTQVIPLSILGIYLAWLVWRTGSLWPAVVVHFANNALAIVIAAYISTRPELSLEDLEQMDIAWYWIVLGLILFGACVLALERLATTILAARGRDEGGGSDVHSHGDTEI